MFKTKLFLIYISWVVAGVIFCICEFLKVTPLILTFLVLFLVLWPGFGISRMTKMKFGEDSISQIATWLMFGLVFILGLNSLTLLFGWTMNALLGIIFTLSFVFFITAFVLDFRRKSFQANDFSWKAFIPDGWSIIILVLSFLMLTVIAFKGSIIKGGAPLFHIAMMLKAISKEPLTLHNIAYQPDVINIAYMFPIWHIFLGICAKISHLDVFTLWQRIILPLSVMSIITWAWLVKKILPTKQTQALGMLFFLIFSFIWDDGYVFTALAIPNTFSQLALLPLAVGVTLYYIFLPTDNKHKFANWPWLITLIPFSVVLAFVHPQGYFYYLFFIGSLLLFWSIFKVKDTDYKQILGRIGLALGSFIIAFIPVVITWQVLGKSTMTTTLTSMWQNPKPEQVRFVKITTWALSMKYAFAFLPVVWLFIKKQRQLIILLSTMIMIPILSMGWIRPIILKTIGYLWLRRLPTNGFWYFLVWALITGFIFLLIDRLMRKMSRLMQIIVSAFFSFILLFLVWLQIQFNFSKTIYDFILGGKANNWFDHNYTWIMIVFAILALMLIILMRFYEKIVIFFQVEEPKNYYVQIILALIFSFLLLYPSYEALAQAPVARLTRPIKANQNRTYIEYYVGGTATIGFIEKNISPKAVFECYNCYYYLLPLVNVKMPIFADNADDFFLDIYNLKLPIEQRITVIDKAKIEYLLIADDPKKISRMTSNLDSFPQYFTRVFTKKTVAKERDSVIYKINREQIKQDLSKK